MSKKNPINPGEYVRYDCIEPLGLTITDAAKVLGVTRQTLTSLVNGKSGVSAEMAVRLEKAFGGSAATWLRLQVTYDLAQVMKRASRIRVRRVRSSARTYPSAV